MRAALAALTAAWALAGAVEAEPKFVIPAPVQVPALASGATTRPLKFARIVVALSEGQVWGVMRSGVLCLGSEDLKWNASTPELSSERFGSVFNGEASGVGFTTSSATNLFGDDDAPDGLSIGVRVLDMQARYCGQRGGDTGPLRYFEGSMLMTAEWQIYDPVKREVVARVKTNGGAALKFGSVEVVTNVLLEAFRENTRALLADESFRRAASSSISEPAAIATRATMIIHAASSNAARPIGEAPGSVVAVFTGSAMGSGFLVSDDGYLLTNQHVVGAATAVRIRWSDGLESAGEVVRVDKRRDVALIKTTPRSGRQPLALRRETPAVGDAVFAIGTPLDPALQSTVTKGIVSANRILDGFAYIQSDVGIDHGNSGGPLLDEKGRVIGITVIKIAPDDGQRGLNLFIPIGDALDFLSLKPGP